MELHSAIVIIYILCCLCFVSGCGTVAPRHPVVVEEKSSEIILDKSNIWPLSKTGTYLQKVHVKLKNDDLYFSTHVTLGAKDVKIIAFNEVVGRLYELHWTPEKLYWNKSKELPDSLRAEEIVTNFLLTYLDANSLEQVLVDSKLYEYGQIRLIKDRQNGKILRKIIRKDPLDGIWQYVAIEDPQIDYKINIEMVPVI